MPYLSPACPTRNCPSRRLELGAPRYRGAQRLLIWSFSGQGGRDPANAADELLTKAWRHFANDLKMPKQWSQVAIRLAERIAAEPSLLVLDGVEVFLHPPGPEGGYFPREDPILLLLSRLAADNRGLCLITCRVPLQDFAASRGTTTPEIALGPLAQSAGAALLRDLGVGGADAALEEAVDALWGHPLSLTLLGGYLRNLDPRCDIGSWKPELLGCADSRGGGRSEQIMTQYAAWMGDEAKLAILRVLSLFDSTVGDAELLPLRQPPALGERTRPLLSLSGEDLRFALTDLQTSGLVSFSRTDAGGGWDLHPVVRSFFGERFRIEAPGEWRAAHARIYRGLIASAEEQPATYDDLLPLHRVIQHGCMAESTPKSQKSGILGNSNEFN